ncbi:MAG TPA: hypothetical protein VD861_02025 [Pyrinomonadaceae bacterium]|nr:hypothetical protein [Pyrinomonadaceae bacterium]
MKVINVVMGLAGIGLGAWAFYLTAAERRSVARPGRATRIVRAVVGLAALVTGVLALLSATGVIFKEP